MTVVAQILDCMDGITKPQRKFLLTLFVTMLVTRTRLNFLNLSRHSCVHEKTYRRQFRKSFDFAALNDTRPEQAPGYLPEFCGLRAAGPWRAVSKRMRSKLRGMYPLPTITQNCLVLGLTYTHDTKPMPRMIRFSLPLHCLRVISILGPKRLSSTVSSKSR